jgi:hypothetical protein
MYSHLSNLYLFPSKQINHFIYAQERIDQITHGFFTVLKGQWKEKKLSKTKLEIDYLLTTKFYSYLGINQQSELDLSRELDEKVFTLLMWLISFLWINLASLDRRKPFILPIMVNQYIKAPELNLQGRPSAVFIHPDNTTLLLIQTYYPSILDRSNFVHLQVAIYARILDSIGVRVHNYLHINYHTMTIIMQEFHKQTEYEKLDNFLDTFHSSIVDHDFDPPKNPPCELCEFMLICKS